MKQLEAGELPLSKVFSSDFDFLIPDYQRPYAWGTEEALQLLDDLEDSLTRNVDEPYFLGSVVLVKVKGEPRSEVIDGQQRLTTLTILLALLRDLTGNADLAKELGEFVQEPGSIVLGKQAKPRLGLRTRDAAFFAKHVQAPAQLLALMSLDDNGLKTDAQKAVRDNAAALHKRLSQWSEEKRQQLAAMLGLRTYLVVVSTPDLASAHRIFSVMNARGLDLSAADIFKSLVIGAVPNEHKGSYAEKWEDAEQDLGREAFADLFLHIRTIVAKTRAQRELLKEFPEQVLNAYLPDRAREFVDTVLLPYSEANERLLNQDFGGGQTWESVNAWLRRLVQLDNNDWRPPALWALRHHGDDPAFLNSFLARLERLAASMLLRRVYATPRVQRYIELLKELESGAGLAASSFDLTSEELAETRARIAGDLYLVRAVRKYVLLRLDEALAKSPGVAYNHGLITVEHVLPQNPQSDSKWLSDFDEDQREAWTHKIANLVLLNRAKNSEAQNYDFADKKAKYFTSHNGVATFALTSQVLGTPVWTPDVLEDRQGMLVTALSNEWSLHGVTN